MSNLDDIFTAKWAINAIKKIRSHYTKCCDCPLNETMVCESIPLVWDTSPMFEEEKR